MQPTYNPSKIKRARKCGFRARRKTQILNTRRRKGRKRLCG